MHHHVYKKALLFQPATEEPAFLRQSIVQSLRGLRVDGSPDYSLDFDGFFYLCSPKLVNRADGFEKKQKLHLECLLDKICIGEQNAPDQGPAQETKELAATRATLGEGVTKTRVLLKSLVLDNLEWKRQPVYYSGDSDSTIEPGTVRRKGKLAPTSQRPEASWRQMFLSQPPLGALLSFGGGAMFSTFPERENWQIYHDGPAETSIGYGRR